MSVNYLNILLDKFMVLIISMSPGIIRRCLIILSADIQQARQWHVPICGLLQENAVLQLGFEKGRVQQDKRALL